MSILTVRESRAVFEEWFMGLISLLTKDPMAFLILAVLLLYSIIAHEVAHGWVAKLFGDTTAEDEGRLTANPMPHIDPIGLLMLFVAGFGWAKPVPVSYGYLRRTRGGLIAVSLAGVAANFVIAFGAALLLQFSLVRSFPALSVALVVAVKINVILAAFNLIPIPPLDGSKVLAEFLPIEARVKFFQFERYGFFVLILLLFTGLLNPVIGFMQGAVYGLLGLILTPFH
jgi:Zn-dependent protease